ncbi:MULTISPECIES: hypothetical protein [Bacteroides]|jgi:hypothetical protein|nr:MULTISPECIES: hypothetical protein [Bacteroides]
MEYFDVEKLLKDVKTVNAQSQYWMVRSMSGDYFHEFISRGYIAIGYNEISLQEIKFAISKEEKANEQLRGTIDLKIAKGEMLDASGEEPNSQYVAPQLLKFCRDIKINDIIVIPGKNSDNLAIARIDSVVYEEKNISHLDGVCQFNKRRKITVLRTLLRSSLSPKMQLMFNSRHIVSNIDSYAPFVDSCVSDFYEKDDEVHLVLRIKTEDDVNTQSFFSLYKLFQVTENFCKQNGIDGTVADMIMKVQMESPGDLRLSARNKMFIWMVALTILGVNGGGLNIKAGNFSFDLSTGGLIEKFNDFLDHEVDRDTKESIKCALDSLEINTPEDFKTAIDLLHEQNSVREKY